MIDKKMLILLMIFLLILLMLLMLLLMPTLLMMWMLTLTMYHQHSGNVTAVLGKSAILNCRVEAVGNRTVGDRLSFEDHNEVDLDFSWIVWFPTHLLSKPCLLLDDLEEDDFNFCLSRFHGSGTRTLIYSRPEGAISNNPYDSVFYFHLSCLIRMMI